MHAQAAMIGVAAILAGSVALVWLLRASRRHERLLARALRAASANVLVLDAQENPIEGGRDGAAVLRAFQASLAGQKLASVCRGHVVDLHVEGAPMRVTAGPVTDGRGARCGTVIEWRDRTAELACEEESRARAVAARDAAREAARLRQALDAATGSVMLIDERNVILYLNAAAQQLMQGCEAQFRIANPSFNATQLVGANFDVFAPAGSAPLLPPLDRASVSELTRGTSTLRVIANPIADATGKRLGSVVEWFDRTQEVAIEGEVQAVICDVLVGDLDRRIQLEGKTGYARALSMGINTLVENVAGMVGEVQGLVRAVNAGDVDRRINTEGRSGLTVKLGAGINELTANVADVVTHLQGVVRAANEGTLDQRIDTEGRSGLMVKLAAGINQLTHGMAAVVSQVKVAAGEVSRGADEITRGNVTLSQRMEAQASSLEETASSMEQMTGTVRQNADNAGQANQLAQTARDHAERGGAVVSRAVQAMAEINRASKRIADIIGVIDEIAFQTNLLALNAAVEAARAGEQGRGFAVVATEVRNLAGRSATAAKEIKALIHDSVQKVEDGSKLVSQSGTTLEQIVASVKRVSDIVAEIAAASHEQSAGIEQVNRAVVQLDGLTQQNATLVEQASAASQAMSGQARRLNTLMQHYQVTADMTAAAREVARAAGAPPADRRRAGRPWSGADLSPAPARTARPAAVASGTDDAVWTEF